MSSACMLTLSFNGHYFTFNEQLSDSDPMIVLTCFEMSVCHTFAIVLTVGGKKLHSLPSAISNNYSFSSAHSRLRLVSIAAIAIVIAPEKGYSNLTPCPVNRSSTSPNIFTGNSFE